jgi:hypothetical protein
VQHTGVKPIVDKRAHGAALDGHCSAMTGEARVKKVQSMRIARSGISGIQVAAIICFGAENGDIHCDAPSLGFRG